MPRNAAIIGRVAVKVIPDTDDFRKDAQRELDAIQKELKDLTVRIIPDLDQEGIVAQAKLLKEEVQKTLGDVKLNVTLDDDTQLRQALDNLANTLENTDVKKEVRPELSQTHMAKVEAQLEFLTRRRAADIRATLDESSLKKVGTALAALSGARVYGMKMSGVTELISNLDKMVPSISAATLGMGGLSIATLTTSSNILSLSGNIAAMSGAALALPGIAGGLAIGLAASAIALKDFKNQIPEITTQWNSLKSTITDNFWSTARAGMQNFVGTLMPQFTSEMGKTSMLLGGWWGQMANDMTGVLGPRLHGMFANMNESIIQASGSTKNLANITGILGSVGSSYLPRLAAFFTDVTGRISDWMTKAEASGQLTGIIDAGIAALGHMFDIIVQAGRIFGGLIKAAEAGGGSTLGSLADGLKTVADTINSPAFQSGLTGLFQAAHDGFSSMATIAGPAVKDMFLNIMSVMTAVLPQIGAIIGQAVGAIATVLADPAIMGGVQTLITGIGSAVQAIAPVFATLGPALAQVMSLIGVMASTLGPIFATAMESVVPIINSLVPPITSLVSILGAAFASTLQAIEPMIQALATAFADFLNNGGIEFISTAMSALMTIAIPLAQAFTTLATTLMSALGPVLPVIGELFTQIAGALATFIADAVNALLPVLPVLVQAFMAILQAIAPLVPVLLNALAPVLPVLADAFAQLAVMIAPLIASLVDALGPILPVIVQMFISLVQALMPVVGVLIDALGPILPIIADAFLQIVNALAPLIPVFMQLLQAIIIPLLPLFMSLVQTILPPLATMFTNLATSLMPFITALTEIINFVMPILIPILQIFVDMFAGAIMGAINGVVNIIRGFLDIITGVWNIISGIFTGDWSKLWEGVKDVFKGVFELIGGIIEFVWNVIIIGTLVSAFGFVKGIFTEGLGFIRGLWEGVWNGIKDFFSGIWNGVKTAVSNGISGVVDFFKGLPGKVMDAVGSLLDKLVSFGGNLLSGLWDGLTGAASWLLQKIGDFFGDLLPGWVKDILGIHSPSKVFAEIGSWLLPGLAQGMTAANSMQTVKDAVGDMHSTLVGEVNTGLLYDAGASLSNSLLDGMESQYSAIKDSLSGLGSDLSKTQIDPVTSSGVATSVAAAASVMTTPGGNTLIYNAAPNSSVDSAEDLFAAATRARMGW